MAPIGTVDDGGRFSLSSAWPGRYVIRVDAPPQGWTVKTVIVNGRDAADAPLDLDRDIDDAVVTFTDRVARLSGTVRTSTGQLDEAASVLLFPVEAARWVDYGRSTRRLRAIPTSGGAFSTPAPPEGDYLLIALPESQLVDWQNPAFLERAAPLADRVTVREGQPVARALQTRSLP